MYRLTPLKVLKSRIFRKLRWYRDPRPFGWGFFYTTEHKEEKLKELAKTYSPKDFEDRIYQEWMEEKAFHPEVDRSKEPYTIVMPPPNVTGNLHMGHALNNTIQDILIRFKRLKGYQALFLPGTDHASISTEAKVVAKIKSEGKTKEDLGREGFLEEAWAWTHEYGGNIKNQLKKLGVSCDWDRQAFTLDDNLSRAVETVFMELYEKDLIYRGDRIINWCPSCQTAISDAEVDHVDHDGKMWTFSYPLADGSGDLKISTTRPETIPGDLAVAVNPEDDRYKDLVGKTLKLPLMDREIPIIADAYVDMEFGTGAVKITPSHDPNDFEVGARHDLGQLIVIDQEGVLNENAGAYQGLDRMDARKKIVEDFDKLGLLVKIEDHHNAVGHCERCKTVIEPLISKQWFVKMEPLAKPALEAYKKGDLHFIPDRFGKIYAHWLENIRDWCISRQLWWGHQLPVYYCKDCDHVTVSLEEPDKCPECGGEVYRDPDTLDTWFSSALWPFSTLGWPEKTEDYAYFYPTNVLCTGYDIIFFWVVRMVFSALEQTGELPFKDVFLTGLVLDEQGRKMSKSLGNGIDPLEIIDQYGADALRFTLITGNSPGNDMRFSTDRVEANRNFANKLWNASRFVLMHADRDLKDLKDLKNLKPEDKWLLSKGSRVTREVADKLDHYDIGLAGDAVLNFIWSDFCDWYIELVKPRLFSEDEEDKTVAVSVLVAVLKDILRLLHPFMPFITEEIWSKLPGTEGFLMEDTWPVDLENFLDEGAEKKLERVQEAIRGIRNARAEMNIAPNKKSKTLVFAKDSEARKDLEGTEGYFKSLGFSTGLEWLEDPKSLEGDHLSVLSQGVDYYMPMEDLVDYEKELERLNKELDKVKKELDRVTKKLSNQGFVSKAPEAVVAKEKAKEDQFKTEMAQLEKRISAIENR